MCSLCPRFLGFSSESRELVLSHAETYETSYEDGIAFLVKVFDRPPHHVTLRSGVFEDYAIEKRRRAKNYGSIFMLISKFIFSAFLRPRARKSRFGRTRAGAQAVVTTDRKKGMESMEGNMGRMEVGQSDKVYQSFGAF